MAVIGLLISSLLLWLVQGARYERLENRLCTSQGVSMCGKLPARLTRLPNVDLCDSVSDCTLRCSANATCTGFNFDKRIQICIFHSQKCSEQQIKPGYRVNYYRKSVSYFDDSWDDGGGEFVKIDRYEMHSGDCDEAKIEKCTACNGPILCAARCNWLSFCRGFSFNFRENVCLLRAAACPETSLTARRNSPWRFYAKVHISNQARVIPESERARPALMGRFIGVTGGPEDEIAKGMLHPVVRNFTMIPGSCPGGEIEFCSSPACKSVEVCAQKCWKLGALCKGFAFDFQALTCQTKRHSCDKTNMTPSKKIVFYRRKEEKAHWNWGVWKGWSSCSTSCNNGVRQRTRECVKTMFSAAESKNQPTPLPITGRRDDLAAGNQQPFSSNGKFIPTTLGIKDVNNCNGLTVESVICNRFPCEPATAQSTSTTTLAPFIPEQNQEVDTTSRSASTTTTHGVSNTERSTSSSTTASTANSQSPASSATQKPVQASSQSPTTSTSSKEPELQGPESTRQSPLPGSIVQNVVHGYTIPQLEGYLHMNGFNCPGYVLLYCPASACPSVPSCATECEAVGTVCKGFTFDFQANAGCWLKKYSCMQDARELVIRNAAFQFYRRLTVKEEPARTTGVLGYEALIGNCPGNFIGSCNTVECSSVSKCAEKCTSMLNCAGFSYNAVGSDCFLKSASCRQRNAITNTPFKFYERKLPCYNASSFSYHGAASFTTGSKACVDWDDSRIRVGSETKVLLERVQRRLARVDGSSSHHFCRNPPEFRESRPWCFHKGAFSDTGSLKSKIAFCSVNRCNQISATALQSNTANTSALPISPSTVAGVTSAIQTPAPTRAAPAASAPTINGYLLLNGDCRDTPMLEYCPPHTCNTALKCSLRCSSLSPCKGFSFNFEASMCVLAQGACPPTHVAPSNWRRFYVKDTKGLPMIEGAATTTLNHTLHNYSKRDGFCVFGIYRECELPDCDSVSACAIRCDDDRACKGFTFDTLNRGCSFHSRTCSELELRQAANKWTYTMSTAHLGCGVPALRPNLQSPRVVGGTPALPHSWPWTALIEIRLSQNIYCMGSVISRRWILTAAHCFSTTQNTTLMRVIIGRHSRSYADSNEQSLRVKQLIRHPAYTPTYDFDAALIELAEPMNFTAYVSPVCLTPRKFPDGYPCWVAGWGATYGTSSRDVLNQIEVPIVEGEMCESQQVTTTMLCAGYRNGGRDACIGDSGAALVCKRAGRWYQVGVVSHGNACAQANTPGIYTSVAPLKTWIEETSVN